MSAPTNGAGSPGQATWAAFALATLAVAGSFGLSLGLSLKACPLCLYQRTFVAGVFAVLAMGLATGVGPRLALLALPLATAGLAIGGFHAWLELSGRLECPPGFAGVGSATQQAVLAQAALFVALLVASRTSPAGLVGGLVLGVALAALSVASAPPLPAAPPSPYTQPLDVCRPPYKG